MLSIQLLRLIIDQREREVQEVVRTRRLLEREPDPDGSDRAEVPYRDPWRARTPRASATTR